MGRGPAPLIIGRSDEVRLVRHLVDGGGGIGVLVFEGEPGIGKTTLLNVACARAERDGTVVLRAAADDLSPMRPLGLLMAALGSATLGDGAVDASLAGAGDDASDAVPVVVDHVLDVLEAIATKRPALVALDDVQWADVLSLRLLGLLCRRAVGLGVRFVVALRLTPRSPEVHRWLDLVRSEGAVVRRLAPFGDAEAVQLAEMRFGGPLPGRLVDRVRHAGGNPFFVEELVRWQATGERLPAEVLSGVAARLRSMGEVIGEVVRVAAVLGSTARPDDLAAVTGRPLGEVVEALSEAAAAELVVEAGSGVTFRHDLVREALLAETPATAQRALHRAAAAALRARGAAPEVVATHLIAGAEPGDRRVVSALRDVARQVVPAASADLLVAALDRCDAFDPERSALALEAANALVFAGRPAEAAVVVARTLDDDIPAEVRYELRAVRSHALFAAGDPGAAVASWMESGVGSSEGAQQRLELAELALASLFAGDATGARRYATEALVAGEEVSTLARSTAHAVLAWLDASAAELDQAMAHAEESVAMSRGLGAGGDMRYGAQVMRAAVADAAGRDAVVEEAIRSARRKVTDHGLVVFEPMIEAVHAIHLIRTGDWDDALAAAEAGVAASRDSGVRLASNWLAAVQAMVLVERDDLEGAQDVLDHGVEPGVLLGQDWVTLARARLLVARQEPAAALALLGGLIELLVTVGVRSCLASAGPDMARLAVDQGDEERVQWMRDVIAGLPTTIAPPFDAAVMAMRGVLDRDPSLCWQAADASLSCRRRPDAARALADAASILVATDPERARNAARRAVQLFEQVGAEASAGRVRSTLRTQGVRFRAPSTPSESGRRPGGLTPTEQRVASLVAAGLSNAAIAARLVVSRRTVESHLVRIYRKVGVATRAELVRWAATGGLREP